MDYLHSTVIDPECYDNDGLSDGIDLRKSNYTEQEDRGAIRCHQDWSKHVTFVSQYKGTLGPEWSFMSVAVPECLPERLEIIAYANEFAFMHDDVTDHVDHDEGEIENNEMMHAFLEGANSASISLDSVDSERMGKRQMQSKLLTEMLAIDPECAVNTMKAWAKFVEIGSSRKHSTVFTSLDEYLPYRIADVGEMFWYGVVTFGMGLKIPEDEMELCQRLMQPAWIAVGLANDIYSWPKERDAAERLGQDHVVNAVYVLMQEHNITADQAIERCRMLSKASVAQYVKVIRDVKCDESISLGLRKYVEAMQYSISGNIVWSKNCPRYNPLASFNKQQLDWMRHGLPASTFVNGEDNSTTSSKDIEDCSGDLFDSQATASTAASSSRGDSVSAICTSYCEAALRTDTIPVAIEAVQAPIDHIESMPSKGVRDRFIDGLNYWLKLKDKDVAALKRIISQLHNASLILDDVQDNSDLRRGVPAAHTIFGSAQAINSAMFSINQAVIDVGSLASPDSTAIILDKLSTLFIGQGLDLYSTYNLSEQSFEQYLATIDKKTGALFELVTDLMISNSGSTVAHGDLRRFTKLFGRYFQIRDDYQNLQPTKDTHESDFCQDFDEGKYTLPLIHLLRNTDNRMLVGNLLSTRHRTGRLEYRQKCLLLEQMKRCGSLQYTLRTLAKVHGEIGREMQSLAKLFGAQNAELQLLWAVMRIPGS